MRRNAAKCGAFLAHFGSIRAILGCFEMRRNAAADPNAAHFGAFRRHARRIMQLSGVTVPSADPRLFLRSSAGGLRLRVRRTYGAHGPVPPPARFALP